MKGLINELNAFAAETIESLAYACSHILRKLDSIQAAALHKAGREKPSPGNDSICRTCTPPT